MIKINFLNNYNLNKFIKWINKKYEIRNGNFYLFVFFCFNIEFLNNKKINFKLLKQKWEEIDFWNKFCISKNSSSLKRLVIQEIEVFIFKEIGEDKKKFTNDECYKYINLLNNLYLDLKNRNLLTSKLTFIQMAYSFLLHYILFISNKELTNNIFINDRLKLRLYLEDIYTSKMQLIFKDNFNDLYLLLNRVLPCE